MSTGLVIVHLSTLDSYADKYGVELAQDLSNRLREAVLAHVGPVFIIDQRWQYQGEISDPRMDFVQRVQLAREIQWRHFKDQEQDWDVFLQHFKNDLREHGVKNVSLGGMWYSPEGTGCVAEAQDVLAKSFKVRVNPRLVGCIPTTGTVR
jgi:hypothetical protein